MELANRVIFEIKGEKGMDVHDLLHNEWRYLQMELQDGPATLFYPLQYVHVCLSRPDEQQTSTNRFFLTTFMDFDDWRSYSAGHQKVIMLPIFPINCESVPSCRDDDDRLVDVFVTAKTSAEAIG